MCYLISMLRHLSEIGYSTFLCHFLSISHNNSRIYSYSTKAGEKKHEEENVKENPKA